MERGRCRDVPTTTFFPDDGVGVEAARRLCAECEVRARCLDYALVNAINHGVWGGTSERERRRCQWPIGPDRWRPSELTARGHEN
jgi:WhiB family redox-sensing transcriptional regulator